MSIIYIIWYLNKTIFKFLLSFSFLLFLVIASHENMIVLEKYQWKNGFFKDIYCKYF